MGYDPIDDGEAFTADGVTDRLEAVQDLANALFVSAIRPRSLGPRSVLPAANTNGGLAAYRSERVGESGAYINVYPGFDDSTYISTAGDPGTGWCPTNLGASWTPFDLTDYENDPYTNAIWIKVNLVCHSIYDSSGGGAATHRNRWRLCLALMWVDDSGGHHIISRTERAFPCVPEIQEDADVDGYVRSDMTVSTILTGEDTGSALVGSVIAVVSILNDAGPVPGGTLSAKIGRGFMSAIPLRARLA